MKRLIGFVLLMTLVSERLLAQEVRSVLEQDGNAVFVEEREGQFFAPGSKVPIEAKADATLYQVQLGRDECENFFDMEEYGLHRVCLDGNRITRAGTGKPFNLIGSGVMYRVVASRNMVSNDAKVSPSILERPRVRLFMPLFSGVPSWENRLGTHGPMRLSVGNRILDRKTNLLRSFATPTINWRNGYIEPSESAMRAVEMRKRLMIIMLLQSQQQLEHTREYLRLLNALATPLSQSSSNLPSDMPVAE